MAGVSLSITKANAYTLDRSKITKGTSTPGTGDIELRFNVPIVENDIIQAMELFRQYLITNSVNQQV